MILQRILAGIMFVIQLIRTAALGSHYQHFTSWNWTLTALYLLLDSLPQCQSTTFTFLGPMALASATYVAYATVYMFCYDADVVVESYETYGFYVVFLANFILHFFDVALCLTVFLANYPRRRRSVQLPSFCLQAIVGGCAQFNFMSAYFYFISAESVYGFHTISDDVLAPLSVLVGVIFVESIILFQYYYK